MPLFSFDFWFWNITVLLYFNFKNLIFSKIFKRIPPKINTVSNILLMVTALLLNNLLIEEYHFYLDLTPVKGTILLPPFSFLFIIADFLSSLAVFLYAFYHLRRALFSNSYARLIIDIGRLFFIYFAFVTLVSDFWIKELNKVSFTNYRCFSLQIKTDLAVYFFRNNKLPEKLYEFTELKVNPVNNSKLVYTKKGILIVKVMDEKDNVIFDGAKVLIGMNIYKDNPSGFFSRIRTENDYLCKGSVKIPVEYYEDTTNMNFRP